jgi:hypothetical protein
MFINKKILQLNMRKLLVLIFLSMIFGLVFAAESPQAMAMPYKYCLQRDLNQQEQCFTHAYPNQINDCNIINPKLENYYSLLLGCYQKLSYQHPEACDLMPLNDANKQLCYVNAKVCDKITNQIEKDECVAAVNKKNISNIINGLFATLGFILYLLSPLAIIAVILKTIIDKIRKKPLSIKSILLRIGIIIALVFVWFMVTGMFCFPPCYIAY